MYRKFFPHLLVNSVYDIDLDELKRAGVRGIIADLDNTLVGAKEPLATPELVIWMKKVQQLGFRVVIVSNNTEYRVSAFAEPLAIPYIYRARKPQNTSFRRALAKLELPACESVVVGDQILTDVLGGNRLGMYTILVKPVSRKDDGMFTKINRRLESVVIGRLRKKGLVPWED